MIIRYKGTNLVTVITINTSNPNAPKYQVKRPILSTVRIQGC